MQKYHEGVFDARDRRRNRAVGELSWAWKVGRGRVCAAYDLASRGAAQGKATLTRISRGSRSVSGVCGSAREAAPWSDRPRALPQPRGLRAQSLNSMPGGKIDSRRAPASLARC